MQPPRLILLAALGSLLALLAACSSSSSDDAAPEVQARLEGFAGNGFSAYGVVAVAGAKGRQSAFATEGNEQYRLDLRGVEGPFLLRAEVLGRPLHSMASGAGHANITLLTEMAVADLFGASPTAVFDAQEAGDSPQDLSILTPDGIARAEARVRALLKRRFGLVPPAALGDFFTIEARLDAGDPTTAFQRTLQARIAQSMQITAEDFVVGVAQRRQACRVQALELQSPDGGDPFCPNGRALGADPGDADIVRHHFTEPFGDSLVLRTRGDEVVDLVFTRHDGRAARCDGPACAGVTLGAAEADGGRRLALTATSLQGDAGRVTVSGTLVSGPPGPVVGGCPGDEITLTASDASVRSHCIGRRAVTPRLGRFEHGLLSMSDPRFILDLILEGDRVVWVMVGGDPMAAGLSPFFQQARCMNDECGGIVVAPADGSGRRRVQFNQVVLLRTDTSGQLIPGETLLLNGAVLTGIPRPEVPPAPCRRVDGSPGPVLRAAVQGAGELTLCDNVSGASRVTEHDDDGDGIVEALSFFHVQIPTDAAGYSPTLSIDHYRPDDGSVASIGLGDLWNNFGGLKVGSTGVAGCTAQDCNTTGLVFEGAPGAWTERIDGLALPERFPNGAPTGRIVHLTIDRP